MIPEIKRFFELKFIQLLIDIHIKLNYKFAYDASGIGELAEYSRWITRMDEFETEFREFVNENAIVLTSNNLHSLSLLPEYKVTSERQKQLSKERFGIEVDVDDLGKLIKDHEL